VARGQGTSVTVRVSTTDAAGSVTALNARARPTR
jgi:hypothetical protein